jgi:hypothetical protein
MLEIRLAYFVSALTRMAPYAIVVFLGLSIFGSIQVENFHLNTPAGTAIEPYVRWILENRYAAIATSVLIGSVSLAWAYSARKAREFDSMLTAPIRRRRNR